MKGSSVSMNSAPSVTADQYQGLWDPDLAGGYPANHFAFRQVLNVLHDEGAERMVEIGKLDARCVRVLIDSEKDAEHIRTTYLE